jgi:TRAP transporter TAXI family solute receptor
MRRKQLTWLVALLLVVLVGTLFAGCAQKQQQPQDGDQAKEGPKFLRIASASMGGNFFPLGSALAQMINEKIDGLNASAQATGGSAENCTFIGQNEVELALVQSAPLREAYEGIRGFDGRPVKNMRGITAIYFNEFHVMVRNDRGIEKIEDLKGKKIAVGPIGGGIEVNSNLLLSAYGITPEDYTPVYGTRNEAVEGLKTGEVDCHIYETGVGSAQVTDAMLSGKVKILPLSDDRIEALTKDNPEFGRSVIPAGTYKGQDQDIPTIAGSSLFVAREDLPEEMVYQITKTLFENLDYLKSFHNYFAQTKPETATVGMATPLHPGAEKYLKEVGTLK